MGGGRTQRISTKGSEIWLSTELKRAERPLYWNELYDLIFQILTGVTKQTKVEGTEKYKSVAYYTWNT